MKWTELEQIIKDTVLKIRFARLDNNSDGVSTALENVKVLCDYMFADGKIDIDEDICRIYGYAKGLHTNTISYINSNDDIKRVLYEDNKAELDKEPASLKELAKELKRIECEAMIIEDTINQYFTRRGKSLEPQQKTIEAPLQPSDGSGGELAGSDKETQPEAEINNFIPLWCDDGKDENQVPPDIKKVFNTKSTHDRFISYCYKVKDNNNHYELMAKKFAEVRYKGAEEKTDKQHTGATLLFNYLSSRDKEGKEQSAPHLDLLNCSYRTWSRWFSQYVKI